MEEKTLKSWSEFKPTIDEIRKKYGFHDFLLRTINLKDLITQYYFAGNKTQIGN